MRRKKTFFLAAVVAAASGAAIYGYNKYQEGKISKKFEEYIKKGDEMLKKEDFPEALKFFILALKSESTKKNKEILEKISEIYFQIKDYDSSLKYNNNLLKIDKYNVNALRRNFECYKFTNKHQKALKNIFLCAMLEKNKFEKEKNEFFEEVLKFKVSERIKSPETFPGKNNIENFLNTFPVFKKEIEEEKINIEEVYKSNKNDKKSLFLKACVEHIKDNEKKALGILKTVGTIYSKILTEYIKSGKKDYEVSADFKEILKEKSDDPSVLFYGTVIYLGVDEFKYEELLEKGLKIERSTPFTILKIIELLKKRNTGDIFEKIKNLIESETKKRNSIKDILKLLVEQFLNLNEVKIATNYYDMLKEIYPESFYTSLYAALISEKTQKSNTEELYVNAMNKFPDNFEIYYRYGCFLLNKGDKRFVGLFEKGFYFSSNFKETFLTLKVLLLYETNMEIINEYPELEN